MLRLSFALGVILTTGCVGTLEPLDPGGDDGVGPDAGPASVARQMFDDEVSPMLGATCASCHTGPVGSVPLKFLGTGAATGYYPSITSQSAVVGNFVPSSATLLTKGAHEGAPAWTTDQSATISNWLLAEAAER